MTLSMHNQSHPWNRTLPYPALTAGRHDSIPHLDKQESSVSYVDSQTHAARTTTTTTSIPNQQYETRNAPSDDTFTYHPLDSAQRAVRTLRVPLTTSTASTSTYSTLHDHSSLVMSAEDVRRSSSPSTNSAIDGSTRFCLCQHEPHIPRPRNAFILFRQHQHAGVIAQNPGLPNPDVSKLIGEQWRKLPEKTKNEWKALAEDEKTRHSQQYPDYRYRPRRSVRHSIPTSDSALSNPAAEVYVQCQKCGGRLVNTSTPPLPIAAVGEDDNMNQMNAKPVPEGQDYVTHQMPHSSHQPTKYFHPMQRSNSSRQEQQPRISVATSHPGVSQYEQLDLKRRRLNGTMPHLTGRIAYPDHYRPGHEQLPTRPTPAQLSPLQISPGTQRPQPTRSGVPYSSLTATPVTPRHDLSLVLPPLQTVAGRPRLQSDGRILQTQRLGVEAMIMSIPILNKIKILSQISPSLAISGSSPSSPASIPETRGAVIAIDGMDSSSVLNITHSLAEQLEKDGTFAVRIFGGPDPFSVLQEQQSRTSTGSDGSSMNFADCLSLITQWHAVSKEIKEYITVTPNANISEADSDTIAVAPTHVSSGNGISSSHLSTGVAQATSTGSSFTTYDSTAAVSPKSTPRMTASTEMFSQIQSDGLDQAANQRDSETPRRTKSRIPAAALIQQSDSRVNAKTNPKSSENETSTTSASNSDKHDRNGSSTENQSSFRSTQPTAEDSSLLHTQTVGTPTTSSSNLINPNRPQLRARSQTPIPIALVPHYQLTTVNALALNTPIKDTYSPHSHWQWLATLWRGCIGPDITIALKSTLDDGDQSADGNQSATSGLPSTGPNTPASAVHPSHQTHLPPHPHQQTHPHGHPQPQVHTPTYSHAHNHQVNSLSNRPGHHPIHLSTTAQTSVEIRLSDFKTIIIKTGSSRYGQTGSMSSTGTKGLVDDKLNSESWEKAKRRVGFEVEEYLRK